MTTDEVTVEGGPERPCGQCGHGEAAHVDHEIEDAGTTIHRTYCEVCEDWHDFVPLAEPDAPPLT